MNTNSESQRIIELDSIPSRAEPVNKLIIKMRNMGVKRPKCRSKFAVMSSVAGVVLLIVGIFLFFAEFSLDDVKTYDGE